MTKSIGMKYKKAVKITMLEFIDKDQSGLVNCELIDCKEKKWSFQGKPAMFTKEKINTETKFPQTGMLPCKIETKRLDSNGKLILLINTARWKVETIEGGGYFEVYENQMVDL